MRHPRSLVLVLLLALTAEGLPSSSRATSGKVDFEEHTWGRGSSPSLTFTVTSGRGLPQKLAGFLYTSELPEAFTTAIYPPQFVGVFLGEGEIQVLVERPPERGIEIRPESRERFVQGALFDLVTGELVDVTNEDYLDILYDVPPTVITIDFETEDDLVTPLFNGQDLSTPPEFGNLFALSSRQPAAGRPHLGPAVFDTDPGGPNAGSSDPDLLVGTGNALILQENPGQSVPGFFDRPDDSLDGGTFVFDFAPLEFIEKVEPLSIDLIDVDGGGDGLEIVLTDVLGRVRVFTVPSGWTEDIDLQGPPGYRTLDLTTLLPQPGFASVATATSDEDFLPGEVVLMEVVLAGSGAIDNLVLAREADPGAAPRTPKLRDGR